MRSLNPADPQAYAHLTRRQLMEHCAAYSKAIHELSRRLMFIERARKSLWVRPPNRKRKTPVAQWIE